MSTACSSRAALHRMIVCFAIRTLFPPRCRELGRMLLRHLRGQSGRLLSICVGCISLPAMVKVTWTGHCMPHTRAPQILERWVFEACGGCLCLRVDGGETVKPSREPFPPSVASRIASCRSSVAKYASTHTEYHFLPSRVSHRSAGQPRVRGRRTRETRFSFARSLGPPA